MNNRFQLKNHQVSILDRPVKVTLSSRAIDQLNLLDQPLLVEMELYFSCLIRKRVLFPQTFDASSYSTEVHPKLSLAFKAVMSHSCVIDEQHQKPDLEAFPIKDAYRFVPGSVDIDYKNSQWTGSYSLLKDKQVN